MSERVSRVCCLCSHRSKEQHLRVRLSAATESDIVHGFSVIFWLTKCFWHLKLSQVCACILLKTVIYLFSKQRHYNPYDLCFICVLLNFIASNYWCSSNSCNSGRATSVSLLSASEISSKLAAVVSRPRPSSQWRWHLNLNICVNFTKTLNKNIHIPNFPRPRYWNAVTTYLKLWVSISQIFTN